MSAAWEPGEASVPSPAGQWQGSAASQGRPAGSATAAGAAAAAAPGAPRTTLQHSSAGAQRCCTAQSDGEAGFACERHHRRLDACSALPPVPGTSAAHEPSACTACCCRAETALPQASHADVTNVRTQRTPSFASSARSGRGEGLPCGGESSSYRRRRQYGRSPLSLLCLAVLAALAVGASGTEINTAVSIFGPWDYELRQDGTSRCTDMVDRSAKLPNSRVLFLPTLFWVSAHEEGYFDNNEVDLDAYFNHQRQVEYYCFNQQFHRKQAQEGARHVVLDYFRGASSSGGASWQAQQHRNRLEVCPPATREDIERFTAAMTVCFRRAVDAGLSVAVSPRLDDGLGIGGWRNGLVFDPYEPYGAGVPGSEELSYVDIIINPLLAALNEVLTKDTKVWFATQGEMSATVIYHPTQYSRLQREVRARLLDGHPASWSSNIKVGLQMNYNKLCACVAEDAIHPNFEHSLGQVIDQFDIPAVSALFQETDFVGMSSYPSLSPRFTPDQLENALWQFAREIKYFGVDLEKLNHEGGKELHWTEYGVGGGTCQTGNCVAETAADASYYPFYGVFGPYRAETDPWRLTEDAPSPPRKYLWHFYNTTARYLAHQKYKFQIDGVFLWSTGSWDVLAVYPESTTSEGSYFDPVVAEVVAAHNAAAQAAGHAFMAPSRAARSGVRKFKSGIGVSLAQTGAAGGTLPQGTMGARQAMSGDDGTISVANGTISPSSRTISVVNGEGGTAATRVISSSGLLGGGGGFLGAAAGATGSVQREAQNPAVAAESSPRDEERSRFATDNELQQRVSDTADVRPNFVPRHKRPRRRKVGAASVAAAV